jgi:hypothetical protein
MMNDTTLGYGLNIRPVLAPQDIAATATGTAWVNMTKQLEATFIVYFGNIAATSADQPVVVSVVAATAAASASEVAVAFRYRLTGIETANTTGANTAATSAGVSIATDDDKKVLLIGIDPAALDGALADASHVRVLVTPDGGASATLVSVVVATKPRYPQAVHISTT